MNDIEFIKKSVPFADGFEIKHDQEKVGFTKADFNIVSSSGFNYRFPEKQFEYLNDKNRWDSEILPLLFSRTIEGINRKFLKENDGFAIMTTEKSIVIYFAYHQEKVFDILNNIDDCKRSTIEYVLERIG